MSFQTLHIFAHVQHVDDCADEVVDYADSLASLETGSRPRQ